MMGYDQPALPFHDKADISGSPDEGTLTLKDSKKTAAFVEELSKIRVWDANRPCALRTSKRRPCNSSTVSRSRTA